MPNVANYFIEIYTDTVVMPCLHFSLLIRFRNLRKAEELSGSNTFRCRIGSFYRPKRSFGQGNIFTSVCLSIGVCGLQFFGGSQFLGGMVSIFWGGVGVVSNFFGGGVVPNFLGGGGLQFFGGEGSPIFWGVSNRNTVNVWPVLILLELHFWGGDVGCDLQFFGGVSPIFRGVWSPIFWGVWSPIFWGSPTGIWSMFGRYSSYWNYIFWGGMWGVISNFLGGCLQFFGGCGLQFFGGVSPIFRGVWSPIFQGCGLQFFRGVSNRNTVNVWPVHILLECILVPNVFTEFSNKMVSTRDTEISVNIRSIFRRGRGSLTLRSEIPERGSLENLDTNLLFEVSVQKPASASQIVSHILRMWRLIKIFVIKRA